MIYNTIKIELCNEKPNSTEHFYSSVWLPASDADILDAYHKARIITKTNAGTDIRIENCPLLPELVGTRLDSPTIDELNFLAKRLGELSEDELTALKAVKSKVLTGDEDEVVSMKDLINLTYGLDGVGVYPGISSDEMLGEFVIDNDLHPDISAIPDQSLYLINKATIGKLHRENEGGVFANGKYVVAGEYELPEVYDGKTLPNDTGELERWFAFRLEIVKPAEDEVEPEPTDDWLFLPADKMEIYAMKNKYGVKRIEDCLYAGYTQTQVEEAQTLYVFALHDEAEEDGFVERLIGCFRTEEQTDEELVSAVNTEFGKDIKCEDFQNAVQEFRNIHVSDE